MWSRLHDKWGDHMRDITPPKRVTSPTWATLSPCELSLSRLANLSSKQSHVICLVNCTKELAAILFVAQSPSLPHWFHWYDGFLFVPFLFCGGEEDFEIYLWRVEKLLGYAILTLTRYIGHLCPVVRHIPLLLNVIRSCLAYHTWILRNCLSIRKSQIH